MNGDFPDAYLSVSLEAPAEGVGIVERSGVRGGALTWNGRRVGTIGAATGGYRLTPNVSGRLLGGVVSVAQVAVLAERFAATAPVGEDLTPPSRSLESALLPLWPTRRRQHGN